MLANVFFFEMAIFLIDMLANMTYGKKFQSFKGQIISKRFFLAEDYSKKRTKTRCILVKTNSFVRFLEESLA